MSGFDSHNEKVKIYDMLHSTVKDEQKATKEIIMRKAIGISMEELQELNNEFENFLESISHLSIYQHLYKDVIKPYFVKLDTDAQHLIKKNYTPEELELMPRETYNIILNQQKTRLNLLQSIIRNYNLRK